MKTYVLSFSLPTTPTTHALMKHFINKTTNKEELIITLWGLTSILLDNESSESIDIKRKYLKESRITILFVCSMVHCIPFQRAVFWLLILWKYLQQVTWNLEWEGLKSSYIYTLKNNGNNNNNITCVNC